MRKTLFASCLMGLLAMTGVASAQGSSAPAGKQAGSLMVRLRAIGVLPQISSSSVSLIGGDIQASNQAAPELDFSYFFTDNLAVELIAATTRHTISVKNSAIPGTVDVGSVWVLPPTLTLQYHFMPRSRFSPYIGAGINVSFFYNSHGASGIDKFNLRTGVGPAIQAGFDYNITGRWFFNADVKQIFVRTEGDVHVANGPTLKAKTWLNPTVVGVGLGYRF